MNGQQQQQLELPSTDHVVDMDSFPIETCELLNEKRRHCESEFLGLFF